MRLRDEDKNYAIVGAVPADAEGITYIMEDSPAIQEVWRKVI